MNLNFNKKLGLRIRELRIVKGIKQSSLADLLEMERSNLTRIEGGKQVPNSENLMKIASILGVELKDIFDFEHITKSSDEIKAEIVNQLENLSHKELNYVNKSIKLLLLSK